MRGYQLAKGMRAVDEPLLQRIGAAIITFRELGKSTNSELYRPLEGEYRGQRYDDGVYMVSRFKGFDDNVLGPPEKAVSSQAKLSDWQLYVFCSAVVPFSYPSIAACLPALFDTT